MIKTRREGILTAAVNPTYIATQQVFTAVSDKEINYNNKKDAQKQNQSNQQYMQKQTAVTNFRDISEDGHQIRLADVQMAYRHMKAWSTGFQINRKLDIKDLCQCCHMNVKQYEFDLGCETSEFCSHGAGYPLLFDSIKMAIIVLTFIFIFCGLPSLVTNLLAANDLNCFSDGNNTSSSEGKKENSCPNNSFAFSSSYGAQINNKDYMYFDTILHLLSVIIIVSIFQFYRRKFRINIQNYDADAVTPEDYTIEVIGIPADIKYEYANNLSDQIKYIFENKIIENKKYKVADINLCFRIRELRILKIKIDRIKKKIYQIHQKLEHERENKGQLVQAMVKYLNLNKKLSNIKAQYAQANEQQFIHQNFVNRCFISFTKQSERDQIIEYFQDQTPLYQKLCPCFQKVQKTPMFKNKKIKLQLAPEPMQVQWFNIQHFQQDVYLKRAKFFFLSIFLMCLGPLTILLLEYLRQTYQSNGSSMNNLFQTLISVMLIMLNNGISLMFGKLCRIMQLTNLTQYYIFFTQFLSAAIFLNSSMSLIITKIYLVGSDQSNVLILFQADGLVDQLQNMFIVNAVLPFLTSIIGFPHIFKHLERVYYTSKSKIFMSQQKLNSIFQKQAVDVPKIYSSLFKSIYMACFFSSILPSALPITIISKLLFYWSVKFNLIRRQSIQRSIGSDLSIEMIEMMELCLPIYSLGKIYFQYLIFGFSQISIITLAEASFGLLHAILPMQELNEKLFQVDSTLMCDYDYWLAYEEFFKTDYNYQNPATSETATRGRHSSQQKQFEDMIDDKESVHFNKDKQINPDQKHDLDMCSSKNLENINETCDSRRFFEIILPNNSVITGPITDRRGMLNSTELNHSQEKFHVSLQPINQKYSKNLSLSESEPQI